MDFDSTEIVRGFTAFLRITCLSKTDSSTDALVATFRSNYSYGLFLSNADNKARIKVLLVDGTWFTVCTSSAGYFVGIKFDLSIGVV